MRHNPTRHDGVFVTDLSPNAASHLLHSRGWEACVDARLLRAAHSWQDAPEFRAHGHALRRFFSDLKMDGVLCVDGRPTVCIKDTRKLSANDVERISINYGI
jgi:hypothetical protein